MRIAWHGPFLGEGSLARVNRNLAQALLAATAIDIAPCGEPTAAVEQTLGLPVHGAVTPCAGADTQVTLRHRWPPAFMNPSAGYYVHVQPWEFGIVPRAWIEALESRADDVWCYSERVRRAYLDAGMNAERVHVVPLGFDPTIYHPGAAPLPVSDPNRCIFLFVGGMTPRKNVLGVIDAYLSAFAATDEVALLVKDDLAAGYYDSTPVERLRDLAARTDVPPVRLLDARYRDGDMARLYRTAAALVQPSRGEGFCLPVLEAMACGVPPIVTAGGATDDFVDADVGWRVPAERRSLGRSVDGYLLDAEGWWLEPDIAQLAATMRYVYEHREETRGKGAAAAARAHGGWTWTHAAQHVAARLDALTATPPRRAAGHAEDLGAYAEDGMLVELFSRLRVVDPYFVEAGAGTGTTCVAAPFARRYGWPGLLLEDDAAEFERLRENYAAFPTVTAAQAFVSAENAVLLFERFGVPPEFDLLSINGDSGAASLRRILQSFRPRVVALAGNATSPAAGTLLGEELGYALLTAGSRAILVRRDLVPYCGFATA